MHPVAIGGGVRRKKGEKMEKKKSKFLNFVAESRQQSLRRLELATVSLSDDSRCVCCGGYVPEGTMVCGSCMPRKRAM